MVSHHSVMSIFHESNGYKKFLFRCSKCWFCCVNIIRRKEKQKDMLGVLTNFVENESRVYFWSCVYLLWQIFNCLPNIWNWDILSSLSHTRMPYAQILLLKFHILCFHDCLGDEGCMWLCSVLCYSNLELLLFLHRRNERNWLNGRRCRSHMYLFFSFRINSQLPLKL